MLDRAVMGDRALSLKRVNVRRVPAYVTQRSEICGSCVVSAHEIRQDLPPIASVCWVNMQTQGAGLDTLVTCFIETSTVIPGCARPQATVACLYPGKSCRAHGWQTDRRNQI